MNNAGSSIALRIVLCQEAICSSDTPKVCRDCQRDSAWCIGTEVLHTASTDRRRRSAEMDDLEKEELDQLLAVFREQSLRILEEMSQDLLALETGSADPETMTRLRRAAHTVKGDSACIGLEGVTLLAHKIEDAFDAVVGGQKTIDSTSVDMVLNSLDAIKNAISGPEVGDVSADLARDLFDGLASIQRAKESADSRLKLPQDRAKEVKVPLSHGALGTRLGTRTRPDFIRVEASKIDALLNLAGELVIARSMTSQLGPELALALPRHEIVDRFNGSNAQMGKLIAELQKNALKMRMVTIDHVFRRFARPMRELAAERGKEIEFQISGGETELDRALIDSLYEPLLHLLRNAVDHGIEARDLRKALRKPEVGRISIRAYHEGNQIIVEVFDDGRGIDPNGLKARAIEAGRITALEAEQMSAEDALDLIFLEGFSTAKEVTQVSGRGVGAAAVKSAIEQLRGSVSVRSQPGAGATFVLRMPLTLAIIRALLFNAAGQLFALPLLAVSEIARADVTNIVHLGDVENYRLRDRFISLVRPGAVLGFDRRKGGSGSALRGDPEQFFIIVLAADSK